MKIMHKDSKLSKWYSKNFKLPLPFLRLKAKPQSPFMPFPTQNQGMANQSRRPKLIAKAEELARVFDHFDTNKDGKISGDELHAYFTSIGESMTNAEAQSVIKEFDHDGDNLLEFDDFVKLMERDGDDDDLKRAFEMFEVDKGCGCITPKGLQNMLNRLGDEKSYDECVSMIGVFDLDGNGVLDFHEFLKMMMIST